MALKLEDLINKKKEPNQILDLSKVRIRSQEEFEKYFDKIPEYKIRPEKVRAEDTRVRDTEFSFRLTKKETRYNTRHEFPYGDPCPPSMKGVRLEDLAAVDISWRMLTMLRPKNRLEEDIFSRLVELGKLRLATRNFEARQLASAASGGPGTQSNALMASLGILVSKSKRGGVETRIVTCKECGVELCTGAWCKEFPYDSYTRMILDKDELEEDEGKGDGKGSRRGSKANKKGSVGGGGKKKGSGIGPPSFLSRGKKKTVSGGGVGGTGKKGGGGGLEGEEGSKGKLGGALVKAKKRRKKRKASKKRAKSGGKTTSCPSSDDE